MVGLADADLESRLDDSEKRIQGNFNSSTYEWKRGGLVIVPSFGLVLHAPIEHGPLASILAQNRIGAIVHFKNEFWQFNSGQTLLGSFYKDNVILGQQNSGKKSGARSCPN